jgi:hypothetical protein
VTNVSVILSSITHITYITGTWSSHRIGNNIFEWDIWKFSGRMSRGELFSKLLVEMLPQWVLVRLELRVDAGNPGHTMMRNAQKLVKDDVALNGSDVIDVSDNPLVTDMASLNAVIRDNPGSRFVFFPLLCRSSVILAHMYRDAVSSYQSIGRPPETWQHAFILSMGIHNARTNWWHFEVIAPDNNQFLEQWVNVMLSDRTMECCICMEKFTATPVSHCKTCLMLYCGKCYTSLKKHHHKTVPCAFCRGPLRLVRHIVHEQNANRRRCAIRTSELLLNFSKNAFNSTKSK